MLPTGKIKGEKFYYEGRPHTFDKLNKSGNTKSWRCQFKNDCNGRIWTNLEDVFIKIVTSHTCDPKPHSAAHEKKR